MDSLILEHNWKTIGYKVANIPPKTFYDYEMGNLKETGTAFPAKITDVRNKIGLVYVSDFAYAASPKITNNWTSTINTYHQKQIPDNNWLYFGLSDWTMTRHTLYKSHVWRIIMNGSVGFTNGYEINVSGFGIRPCFYLNSNIEYIFGDGSLNKPFRIE